MNPLTEAASVMLARGPGSMEVYVVRRAPALRFFGGFYAFPGGKVHSEDAALAAQLLTVNGPPSAPDVRRVTAVRELFEETGVLLARRPDGSFLPPSPELTALRQRGTADDRAFGEGLRRLGLRIHAEDLRPIGTLVTPPFTALRFDTAFFQADLPPGQQAEVWPGELDEGRWTTAAGLLAEWTRGTCLVSPPTLSLLEAIRDRPVAAVAERIAPLLRALDAGAIPPIAFAPGVQMIPLATMALPPSTHTNAYLVGSTDLYLFDPGPAEEEEQQRLFAVLDASLGAGRHLRAIVLTHHHPDHIGAATACARRYRVPIWAHPWTAQKLAGRVPIDREIGEGDRLDLGAAPDGGSPWFLDAIHTPGHAPGHLVFYEPHYRVLLAGDLVSTLSSIIIAPPDGDLAVYLASLRRLQAYDCRLLLPAHGNASTRPAETLADAIAHRAKREEQLLAALAQGPRTIAEVVPELYRGLPEKLTRFAELQVLAGLRKLEREGVVEAAGESWRLTTKPGV